MKRKNLVIIGTLAFLACQDSRLPVDGGQPSFAVSDGANGGNEHFYFLPPIVPTPNPTGVFNANMRPRVNVWGPFDDDATAQCTSHEANPPGPGRSVVHFEGDDVAVDPIGERYSVGWQTGAGGGIESEKVYRICVWSRSVDDDGTLVWELLGFRDVKPEDSNQDNRSTAQTPVFEFNNGSNLPLKFIIEKGALCDDSVGDCTEAVFAAGIGGSAICASGTCAIDVPGGALDEETAFIIQQEVCQESGELHPTFIDELDLPQFPGCISLASTDDAFAQPVVVAACITPSAALDRLKVGGVLDHDRLHRLQLHHGVENALGEIVSVEALPNTFSAIDVLCSQQIAAGPKPDNLWEYAAAGFRAAQRVLLPFTNPKPAYAINRGFGGKTSFGSPFVWALPSQMEKVNWTNPETVIPGSDEVIEVLVTDAGEIDDCSVVDVGEPCIPVLSGSQPVWGARVHFEITSALGGSVTPVTAISGPDGIARAFPGATVNEDDVVWTIGAEFGAHTLEASGLGLGLTASEGGTGPFAVHFVDGDPADAIVTLGQPPLVFAANAFVTLAAEYTALPDGVRNKVMDPPPVITVTSAESGAPIAGATCTLTGAFTNNGSPTRVDGDVSVVSDANGLCTFDNVKVTKTGALHWEAVVTHPAGLNSPLSLESSRFHIKPK